MTYVGIRLKVITRDAPGYAGHLKIRIDLKFLHQNNYACSLASLSSHAIQFLFVSVKNPLELANIGKKHLD